MGPRDRWNGYAYRFGEGQVCLVSYNLEACEPQRQAPHCAGRRVVALAAEGEVRPTGLPWPQAFERMRVVEQTLVERLNEAEVSCWHVGTQTYAGRRELVFEVADVPGFEQVYTRFATGRPDLELRSDQGWDFFNDRIRPGQVGHNHISNREVIEALKQAGSNLESPHAVDHTFVGSAEALSRLASALEEKGLRPGGRTEGHLTMTHDVRLDEQLSVDTITLFLRRTAEAYGVDYDGWGALVVH